MELLLNEEIMFPNIGFVQISTRLSSQHCFYLQHHNLVVFCLLFTILLKSTLVYKLNIDIPHNDAHPQENRATYVADFIYLQPHVRIRLM